MARAALAPLPVGVNWENAPFQITGSHVRVWKSHDPELGAAGPAGTGKTRTCLEKFHGLAVKYPGAQLAFMRKTRESLTNTILNQFERKVLPAGSGIKLHDRLQRYPYPNGSFIVVGGLDKTSRIMGGEYDAIYISEVNELTEGEYEDVNTRLRVGVMPYKQLLVDCNPQSKTHWIYRRMLAGKLKLVTSTHDDNPAVTDDYLTRLDSLTGVRYKRLRLGLWVAAEGQIYDIWDEGRHRRLQFPIPRSWPRVWSVDFGHKHPFVWQAWAQDPDGRLYRYAEVYRTDRIVEDHAKVILNWWKARNEASHGSEPAPIAIVCDHDREDRATLERHLGMATIPAIKNVSAGIQNMYSRLRGDRWPRMFFLYDSLIEPPQEERVEARQPIQTEDEVGGYVWDTAGGKKIKEEPLKIDDDGLDAARYAAAYFDQADSVTRIEVEDEVAEVFRRGSMYAA
jgi:hypothetical protein